MNRCNKCGYHFRTLEDEQGQHECPRCGWAPWLEKEHKETAAYWLWKAREHRRMAEMRHPGLFRKWPKL